MVSEASRELLEVCSKQNTLKRSAFLINRNPHLELFTQWQSCLTVQTFIQDYDNSAAILEKWVGGNLESALCKKTCQNQSPAFCFLFYNLSNPGIWNETSVLRVGCKHWREIYSVHENHYSYCLYTNKLMILFCEIRTCSSKQKNETVSYENDQPMSWKEHLLSR